MLSFVSFVKMEYQLFRVILACAPNYYRRRVEVLVEAIRDLDAYLDRVIDDFHQSKDRLGRIPSRLEVVPEDLVWLREVEERARLECLDYLELISQITTLREEWVSDGENLLLLAEVGTELAAAVARVEDGDAADLG